MQPRGVNGASASKISLIDPMPASLRWATKPLRNFRAVGFLAGMDLQIGVDVRADQPAPDGSLMIGGIARAEVAVVLRLVIRMARRQRPQADGRQQSLGRDLQDRGPTRCRIRARGKSSEIASNLIRPAGGIVAARAVDHVVKMLESSRPRIGD